MTPPFKMTHLRSWYVENSWFTIIFRKNVDLVNFHPELTGGLNIPKRGCTFFLTEYSGFGVVVTIESDHRNLYWNSYEPFFSVKRSSLLCNTMSSMFPMVSKRNLSLNWLLLGVLVVKPNPIAHLDRFRHLPLAKAWSGFSEDQWMEELRRRSWEFHCYIIW